MRLAELREKRRELVDQLNELRDTHYTLNPESRTKRVNSRDIEKLKQDLQDIDLEIKIKKKETMNLNFDPPETPIRKTHDLPRTPPPNKDGAYIEDIFEDESSKLGAQAPTITTASKNFETPIYTQSNIPTGAIPKLVTATSSASKSSTHFEHYNSPFRTESKEDKAIRLEMENKRLKDYYENLYKERQNFELKKGPNLKKTQAKFEPYKPYFQATPQVEFLQTSASEQRPDLNIRIEPPTPLKVEFPDQHIPSPTSRTRNYENQEPLNESLNISYPRQNYTQERNFIPNQNLSYANAPRESYLRRLRVLPSFSGESYKELKNFIEVADSLSHTATNQAENQEFYDQMITQLRGEPRTIALDMQNYDWPDIRSKLLQHFEYLSNKILLTSQIENLRQEKDETLAQYAERVRKLLNEKNITYTFISEEQRAEHNRTARKAFTKGVRNNALRERMLIRGASSLEDAIAYALEAETETLTQIPQGELFCKTCRVPGHRQIDCRRLASNNEGVNQIVSALQVLGIGNRNNFANNQRNRPFNNGSRFGNNFNRNNQNFNRNFNGPNNFNNNRNWNGSSNFNRNWNGPSNFNRNWNGPNNFNNQNPQNDGRNFNDRNNNFNNSGFNRNNGQNSQDQFNQNRQNTNFGNNRQFGQNNQPNRQRNNNFQQNQPVNTVQTGLAQIQHNSEN